jgi:hypothetical protein
VSGPAAARPGGRLVLALAAAALLALGAWLERSPPLAALRHRVQSPELPRSAFPSGGAVASLVRLGRLHGRPPAPGGEAPYTDYLLGARPLDGERAAAALRVDPRWLDRPVRVASLQVDPADLDALFSDPMAHGRATEKPAFFALIDNGEVRFASEARVRLHGGWLRRKRETASYRVYLRRGDGAVELPAELLPGYAGGGASRLVVRRDGDRDRYGRSWQFVNPIGLDVVRRAGVDAPLTWPAVFYLNGELRGVWSLAEHLGEEYFGRHRGHERFDLVEARNGRQVPVVLRAGDPASLDELDRWLGDPRPMTLERARRTVDVECLWRWIVAMLACGNEDAVQGLMARDAGRPDSRWFWVAWDLDVSFGRAAPPGRPVWRRDLRGSLLRGPDPRARLARRLLAEDPAAHGELARIADDVLGRRLGEGFLYELEDRYTELAAAYGLGEAERQGVRRMVDYLRRRRPVVAAQLAEPR